MTTRVTCHTCQGTGELRRDLSWNEITEILTTSNDFESIEDAIGTLERRRDSASEKLLRAFAERGVNGYIKDYALAVAEEIRMELVNFPEATSD